MKCYEDIIDLKFITKNVFQNSQLPTKISSLWLIFSFYAMDVWTSSNRTANDADKNESYEYSEQ